MAVGDDGTRHGRGGIDMEIAGYAIKPGRFGPEPGLEAS
jgi:hypothetical protein